MHTLTLPSGATIPTLGLGTWRLGESRASRAADVAAVRTAIEIGYRLIDTAEMYGEGGAEEVVGQAVAEALRAGDVRRDELFIVSKVYPHNASRRGTLQACERSRRRLGLDQIDLYLLHWRGATPAGRHGGRDARAGGRPADRALGRQQLRCRRHGRAARGRASARQRCANGVRANQVYFSLGQRGAAFRLLPWLRAHAVPLMAYSPIDQGSLAGHKALTAIGAPQGLSAAQVALAWVLQQPGVVAIPKAVKPQHLRDNFAAADISLNADQLRQIDHAFPPPRRKAPLAMI